MYKKTLSVLMALLLLTGCVFYAQAAAGDTGFSDVNAGDWFADAVVYCRENGLMSGTGGGRFTPNGTASRAMLVTVLHRQAGSPAAEKTYDFPDVPANAYYKAAVDWGAENTIISGYTNGNFGPNDPVTREQLAALLWRAEGRPEVSSAPAFSDADQISNYAVTAVNWARSKGIVSGKGNNRFDPKGRSIRAEMASMLMRWLEGKETEPTPSPDPFPSPVPGQGKVLIAYFSCTNNTEKIANLIGAVMPEADLYEITPQIPYTSADLNYNNSGSRANREQRDASVRPAISGSVADMGQYDVVFIGYPIWHGQAPRIISTFLESYDFSCKTILLAAVLSVQASRTFTL